MELIITDVITCCPVLCTSANNPGATTIGAANARHTSNTKPETCDSEFLRPRPRARPISDTALSPDRLTVDFQPTTTHTRTYAHASCRDYSTWSCPRNPRRPLSAATLPIESFPRLATHSFQRTSSRLYRASSARC